MLSVSILLLAFVATNGVTADDAAPTVKVWPNSPPKWTAPKDPEANKSGPDSRTVAGKSVVRLGNVSSPELHLYPARGARTTVIICPGGGYSILAWDLEGTEVAQWLQSNGVNAAVLKYRVPTRDEDAKWLPPVQDLQRSIAMIRDGAIVSMRAQHVGILGFSAGGHAVSKTALAEKRLYEPIDKSDEASVRPDFAALVYPAYLTTDKDSATLSDEIKVTANTPPMFFAHAFDDSHTCMGSVGLFAELQRNKIPSSLHVFSSGGHGFGGRDTGDEKDLWLPLLKAWLDDRGF